MSRLLVLTTAVGVLNLFAPGRAAAADEAFKHPHMHHAVHEMREAQKELKAASHDYGGHRAMALDALDKAIKATESALEAAGDPYKGYKGAKEIYKDYKNHPHLREALKEMREAEKAVKEAKLGTFKGHKAEVTSALHDAVAQVKLCIENIK